MYNLKLIASYSKNIVETNIKIHQEFSSKLYPIKSEVQYFFMADGYIVYNTNKRPRDITAIVSFKKYRLEFPLDIIKKEVIDNKYKYHVCGILDDIVSIKDIGGINEV